MNPLVYRGVFSRPQCQSKNLLSNKTYNTNDPVISSEEEPANPPSQSEHVLSQFGYAVIGGKARYVGFEHELITELREAA